MPYIRQNRPQSMLGQFWVHKNYELSLNLDSYYHRARVITTAQLYSVEEFKIEINKTFQIYIYIYSEIKLSGYILYLVPNEWCK